jgi:cytochrome c biogenesis protein CcmG, thiol:disulfide interchange protein DsbE
VRVGDPQLEGADAGDDEVEPVARPARRGRLAALVTVPIAVVLIAFVVILATRDPASDRQVESPLLGQPAPRIEGTTIEGRPFDSSAYDGRWLLVNFFATWCVPCVQEHPELIAFDRGQSEVDGTQTNVVSVVFSDEEAAVQRFFERNGGDWPVVLTDDAVVAQWGVAGVPESYLVDPGGTVRAKLVGGVTAAGLDQLVAEVEAASLPQGEGGG